LINEGKRIKSKTIDSRTLSICLRKGNSGRVEESEGVF
jgi:hypothetical protein